MTGKKTPASPAALQQLKFQYNLSTGIAIATTLSAAFFLSQLSGGRMLDLDAKVEPLTEMVMKQDPKQDRAAVKAQIQVNADKAENYITLACVLWPAFGFGMYEFRRRRYNKALENTPS